MRRRSLQLSLREKPQAVDYDCVQQLVALSTSSSLSIYRISSTLHDTYSDSAGCPSHVIYYEDSHSTRGTKLQKNSSGSNLVASLKDVGCVSIYDVNSKSMRSLVDYIPPSQSIVDMNWSTHNATLLATCSSSGMRGLVNLWDVRTAVQPVLQVAIGSDDASMVDWWPTDPNIVSACRNRECLMLLDIRMSTSQSSAASAVPQGVRRTKAVHSIRSPGGRICSYAWHHSSNESSSIIIATENGILQNEVVSYDEPTSRLQSKSSASVQSKFIGNRSQKVLADPAGKMLLLVDLLGDTTFTRSSIYAASSQEAFSARSRDGCTDEVFCEIAGSDVPLVDALWVPAVDGYSSDCSSHLMVLTSGALLQILPIASNNAPQDVAARNDLKSKLDEPEQAERSSANYPHPHSHPTRSQKYSIESLKMAVSHCDDVRLYRTDSSKGEGLAGSSRRNTRGLSPHPTPAGNSAAGVVVGPATFCSLIEEDISVVNHYIGNGALKGCRISVDQFLRRVYVELLIPNIDLFPISNKNSSSFDCYYQPEELLHFKSARRPTDSIRIMELIISFPVKYASFWSPSLSVDDRSGLEFAQDSLCGLLNELSDVCKSFNEKDRAGSYFSSHRSLRRLSSMDRAESSGLGAMAFSEPLLLHIVKCFKRRLFKVWESIIDSNDRFNANASDTNHSIASTSITSDAAMHNSAVAEDGYSTFIKELQQREGDKSFSVPLPLTSGGVFNAKGQLVCFGSARLVLLADPSTDKVLGIDKGEVEREPLLIPSEEHHVSYAETLIKIIKSKKRKNSSALSDINYDDDHEGDDDREGDDDQTDDEREFWESKVNLTVSLADSTATAAATAAIVSWDSSAIIDKSADADDPDDYQFTFDSAEVADSPFDVLDKCLPESSSSEERKESTMKYPSSFHSAAIGISLNRKQTNESESTDVSLNYSHPNSNSSHRNHHRRRTTHETSNRDLVTLRLYVVAFKLELALLHGYVSYPISKVRGGINSARRTLSTDEAHSRARCCTTNADIACRLSPGDVGLGQYWRLLAVVLEMLTITDSGALIDWSSSLGGSLLLQLYLHMKEVGDMQTYAVTICTFGGADVLMELLLGTCNGGQSKHLLDRQQLETEMNYVLYYYSDLLHRWGEHMHAVEVSKFINYECIKACSGALPLIDPRDFIMNVQVRCMNCRAEMGGSSLIRCSSCHQRAQNCSICEMTVRGNMSICGKCGHGGHFDHMKSWFSSDGGRSECPTGCGCLCEEVMGRVNGDAEVGFEPGPGIGRQGRGEPPEDLSDDEDSDAGHEDDDDDAGHEYDDLDLYRKYFSHYK